METYRLFETDYKTLILFQLRDWKIARKLLCLRLCNIFEGHILASTLCSLWELFKIAEDKNVLALNLVKGFRWSKNYLTYLKTILFYSLLICIANTSWIIKHVPPHFWYFTLILLLHGKK